MSSGFSPSSLMLRSSFALPFVFTSNPLQADLLAATAYAYAAEQPPPAWPAVNLAAREIAILKADEVVVAPVMDAVPVTIWVISAATTDGDDQSHLEARMERLGLKKTRRLCPPEPHILESAVQFSAQTRMAPMWNRILPYMVSAGGRNAFVRCQMPLNAASVKLHLMRGHYGLQLVVRAGQVLTRPPSFDDFQPEPLVGDRFVNGDTDVVPGHYLGLSLSATLNILYRL